MPEQPQHKDPSQTTVPPPELRGWIVPMLRALFIVVTYPSDRLLGSRLILQKKEVDLVATSRRARHVDTLVAASFLGELVCYALVVFSPWGMQWVAAIALCWRITDIVATTVRVSLLDRFEVGPLKMPVVASHVRIVVLGLLNYVELWLCFGGLYALAASHLKPAVTLPGEWLTPLYFSGITQLTIGYGDIVPAGIARAIVLLQGAASLLLLVLIVGRFVSLLRPEKSLDESDGPAQPTSKG